VFYYYQLAHDILLQGQHPSKLLLLFTMRMLLCWTDGGAVGSATCCCCCHCLLLLLGCWSQACSPRRSPRVFPESHTCLQATVQQTPAQLGFTDTPQVGLSHHALPQPQGAYQQDCS